MNNIRPNPNPRKEGTADMMNRLNFYDTSFACLHFLMIDFDNDMQEMKRKKDFHPLQLLNKHDRASLDLEVRNIIRVSLASKMLDIQSDELLDADLYFEKQDELDIGEDARIIAYVFRDFVKQRIEAAIKTIEEEKSI
ncbi:hypothetical protein IH715_23600 [Escherichia coli]|nr:MULTISPECIES: hypothetical protein [Enterobacteriaceae]EBS0857839.1 hypothetical protein [Salmonella enterica subsp. enterica serovar Enteritidis]EBX2979294.1 hypothetical protein [Salmonella enterica subsp. enterica serovar Agona]ECD0498804.1 hypothetical protein [Salmonella enterica subsp. enterica serovar Bareilly]ECK6106647.1 hypothetical protein [Salmonella enterica]ECO0666497.1 hypothetical protein [Salmonella enterica subsp. enterica serovar Give]EDV0511028.1 hypothetical protein [S